jgi:hypothetical protein
MVNVATSYSGQFASFTGTLVIRLSDGDLIRAESEAVTLAEHGLIVTDPAGRQSFYPLGNVVSLSEADPGEPIE